MATTRNYFQKFPSISYNDLVVRDISLRTKLTQYLMETGVALLPYTVKDGERADNIAAFYYEDPYYAWAIYLVNGIVDPYSEWPKDSVTLNNVITAKYGSIEAAMDTILRYEVNWASDTTLLSPASYNALQPEQKKYWSAQYGYNREVINYFRTELDWILDNNRLDRVVAVSNDSISSLSNSFSVGERVYQYNYLNDVAVKSTIISIDNVIDANTIELFYSNTNFYDITFTSGNANVVVKSTANILPKSKITGTNIPANTYVKHIIDGSTIQLTAAPTGAPAANSSYSISNPSLIKMTVQKVDFSDVRFANSGVVSTPNSFFTYETGGAYMDEKNFLVGRKGGANVVVLTHERLDENASSYALLSNSALSIHELQYWKPVSAYDEEITLNEMRKEIYVLDVNAIGLLDNNLEALIKNV